MKFALTSFFIIFLIISSSSFSQLDSVYYQGPSVGSVTNGAVQTTDNFSSDLPYFGSEEIGIEIPLERFGNNAGDMINGWDESQLPEYIYMEDTHQTNYNLGNGGQTVLLNSFAGIPMTNYIPPDPVIATGPEHIIICANSLFRILDKQGNVLKIIPAASWWSPAWPDENGDPQVLYDFYEQKWIIVWMQVNSSVQTAGNLIAYSDDSNPLGTWYMYRLDTKKHGTIPANSWGDYPHVGFDEEAIYITTRCIDFGGGGHLYNKVRIINKSDLYNSNGGSLTYTDFWDIRKPGSGAADPVLDFIHPGISYTPGNGGWLFWASGIYGGDPVSADFYSIYKIVNPLTSPSIRGKVLPVQTYTSPPLANQLGGGLGVETIGWITRQPIIRDGFLYTSHDIQNSLYSNYSSIKYLKIDLSTISIAENVEYGAEGYFYLFPALTVDKEHNIAVTFSRTADTEYIGAYYTTWHANDPTGFKPSLPFAEGLGNYVVTYSGNINRWGDYFGIYLDPSNDYDIWMISEYAANTNIWGTQVGQIRMVPFPGIYSFYFPTTSNFGDVEVSYNSEERTIIISNYGEDDLIISDIASSVGPFIRSSAHTFPDTLHSYDSLLVRVKFSPTTAGDYDEMLPVVCNDPAFTGLHLTGHAYDMLEAFTNIFYASTGTGNNGDILTLSRESGIGTTLGNSLYSEVKSITVDPVSNIIYGLVVGITGAEIVRVNAGQGDSYKLVEMDLPFLSAIAFDSTGSLYAAQQSGEIYKIDLTNGSYTLITTAGIYINAIAFHPKTNELWAAKRKVIGTGRDEIYKINLTDGTATLIGSTGFGVLTNDLAFDENNKLFGVLGAVNESGRLIEINTVTGNGTLIGEIGFNHVVGLGYSLTGPVNSVDDEDSIIPTEYSIKQNYPNPFNPTTRIEFSIPVSSDVQLVVYNILGQIVSSLISEQRSAGNHSIDWNANDSNGKKLSSGIYFYLLKATGIDGKEFREIKKMVLLK
jgi:hypothetical protein